MTSKFTKFKNAYINHMNRRARAEVYRVLVNQSDRSLTDMGISRELLAGGVSNWPWTAPADDNFTLNMATNGQQTAAVETGKSDSQQIAKAIRELNSYSDHELHDLGINRGMIRDAVINGRVGIDTNTARQTNVATAGENVVAAAPKVANVGVTQNSANGTDQPQPPMTPPSSGGGSRQAA